MIIQNAFRNHLWALYLYYDTLLVIFLAITLLAHLKAQFV